MHEKSFFFVNFRFILYYQKENLHFFYYFFSCHKYRFSCHKKRKWVNSKFDDYFLKNLDLLWWWSDSRIVRAIFKMCHDKKNKSYSYRKKVNEQETITMWKKYNRWTFNDKNNQQNFKNDHSNYWNFAKDKITL